MNKFNPISTKGPRLPRRYDVCQDCFVAKVVDGHRTVWVIAIKPFIKFSCSTLVAFKIFFALNCNFKYIISGRYGINEAKEMPWGALKAKGVIPETGVKR